MAGCADFSDLLFLPGDRAPSLDLEIPIGEQRVLPTSVDKVSLIVLWNAGCAGCVEVLENLSALDTEFKTSSYGVAIMVRDVEATLDFGRSLSVKSRLFIEATSDRTRLSRGEVTRAWFEASGHVAVPAAFVVDASGVLLWTGYADALVQILGRIRDGNWDIVAAREQKSREIDKAGAGYRSVVNDMNEALMVDEVTTALQIINVVEQRFPSILQNGDYCLAKLQALLCADRAEVEIQTHYEDAIVKFADDFALRIRLASEILRHPVAEQEMLQLVLRDMKKIDQHDAGVELGDRVRLKLALTRASAALGKRLEAEEYASRLRVLIKQGVLPPRLSQEIEEMTLAALG
ncbi:redoxin domain-containing protein [bacterium M00.F.Ca.ET.194.01.1.1]|nr:redoxin domain-containing protein [bacterium M00.F.Ca.ET.194.01.1.1]TGS52561.1 redoxin domain-containing protein [bacterium M00.F.Ca.ET.179.01.1.1]TGV44417.1 redoxin domain-containing protein [bacterium M00.F.Ca.ET.168.01.1.1]